MCSAHAAKGDSLHDLLAAGRTAVLLPPGQRHFASGDTFLDEMGAIASAQTHVTAQSPRSPSEHIHTRPSPHQPFTLLTLVIGGVLWQCL